MLAGGGPEDMAALLEGESLFNDASAIVLFDIFLQARPLLRLMSSHVPSSIADEILSRSKSMVLAISPCRLARTCGTEEHSLSAVAFQIC